MKRLSGGYMVVRRYLPILYLLLALSALVLGSTAGFDWGP